MVKADVAIIGGSAAGPVAAITARRRNRDSRIVLVRKEDKVMVPCGIPYIFGTVGSPDKNVIPDSLLTDNGVELIVDEVTSIDEAARSLSTSGGQTIDYGKLVLATGSLPAYPPIPGIDLQNVFLLWKDAESLSGVQRVLNSSKDIVIVGCGFIGVEMADECKKIGDVNVTIVEIMPQCLMLAMDEEFRSSLEDKLVERGVKVFTNNGVRAIYGNGKVDSIELQSGDKIKADAVIVGIGVIPNVELAQKAGLKIGEQQGIWVDEYMRTSGENIFACGDCAEKTSFFTKRPSALRLASIATFEARIAGANVFGLDRKNRGSIGVLATCVGDFAVSVAGLAEKAAEEAGFDVVIGEAIAPDKHPGSMPEARQLKVKMIFDRQSRRLLGGEVSGGMTTAEIGNIAAMAIQAGMTVDELVLFQMGTHPALTSSPIVYPLVNAVETAIIKFS